MSITRQQAKDLKTYLGTDDEPDVRVVDERQSPRVKKANLLILMDQKRKRMFRKSLYYAAKYVLGYSKMEPRPHGELCEWIESTIWDDTMLLVPRGTYKSTLMSVSFPIWMLEANPDLRIVLSSAEHENTKGWLKEIRLQLEHNEDFKELFGDWKPDRYKEREQSWTSTALRIKPCTRRTGTSSLVATSYKITKVSQHFDIGVFDDLMNEKTVRSRELINKCEEHLNMYIPILDPIVDEGGHGIGEHGPRKVVGTRWGHDDIYARLKARDERLKKKGMEPAWSKFIKKYKDSRGKLFFPKVFTDEFIQNLIDNEEMTWAQISAQFFNDPQPDETQTFKLKHFGFWNEKGRTLTPQERDVYKNRRSMPAPEVPGMRRIATIDPAATDTDHSDWTAIVGCGITQDRQRFLLEILRGRWPATSEIVENAIDMHLRWDIQWWGCESIAFQMMLKVALNEAFKRNKIRVPMEELEPHGTRKDIRIHAVEPFITTGNTFFKCDDDIDVEDYVKRHPSLGWDYDKEALYQACPENMIVLMDELLRFPTSPTRDCADGLAYMVPHFSKDRIPKPVEKKGGYMSFDWWRKQARTQRRLVD